MEVAASKRSSSATPTRDLVGASHMTGANAGIRQVTVAEGEHQMMRLADAYEATQMAVGAQFRAIHMAPCRRHDQLRLRMGSWGPVLNSHSGTTLAIRA